MPLPILDARAAQAAIAALASRQHGVVSRAQLIEGGFGADRLDWWLRVGRLRALHHGVYVVGPLDAPHAKVMAAVLACGRSAAVSHLSAAALWRSVPGPDPADDVDVVIPCALRRARTGIRVHRVRGLRPDEVTTLEGIPLTTPGRTLVDLAGTVSQGELERALAETFARRLTSRRRLEALLARHAGRRGTSRLRALLGSGAEPAWTRSDAEGALLRLIGKAQLPLPEVNVVVGGFEVDFYWRRHRLVAELDGFAFHSSRRSFESDRRRDATLLAAGLRVMRVTWHQLQDEPEALLVLLARALTSAEPGSGALGPPRGPSRRRTRRDTPT